MDESEYVRKGKQMAEGVSKTVGRAAETVSKQSENLTQSNIFQSVSQVS
jgi:import inner membrane translocase subunit TIM44